MIYGQQAVRDALSGGPQTTKRSETYNHMLRGQVVNDIHSGGPRMRFSLVLDTIY